MTAPMDPSMMMLMMGMANGMKGLGQQGQMPMAPAPVVPTPSGVGGLKAQEIGGAGEELIDPNARASLAQILFGGK